MVQTAGIPNESAVIRPCKLVIRIVSQDAISRRTGPGLRFTLITTSSSLWAAAPKRVVLVHVVRDDAEPVSFAWTLKVV